MPQTLKTLQSKWTTCMCRSGSRGPPDSLPTLNSQQNSCSLHCSCCLFAKAQQVSVCRWFWIRRSHVFCPLFKAVVIQSGPTIIFLASSSSLHSCIFSTASILFVHNNIIYAWNFMLQYENNYETEVAWSDFSCQLLSCLNQAETYWILFLCCSVCFLWHYLNGLHIESGEILWNITFSHRELF